MTKPGAGQLRDLRRESQRLKAQLTIGKAGLADSQMNQIRAALERTPLLKVRVLGHDREAIGAMAERIAAEAPCVVVARVGFVLTLYRPAAEDS